MELRDADGGRLPDVRVLVDEGCVEGPDDVVGEGGDEGHCADGEGADERVWRRRVLDKRVDDEDE